jgi:RNA polymerase sigma-70 factor (ECF subfamily)
LFTVYFSPGLGVDTPAFSKMPRHETSVPLTVFPSAAAPLDVPLDAEHGRVAAPSVRDEVLEMFDAHAPAVRRYVRACGVSPDVADDIVQETFVALFQHLRKGGGREHLRGWVMQVGYRLALKHRRGEGRRRRWQGPWEAEAAGVADPAAGPEEMCAVNEDWQRARAVLKALPERDRQCVYLRAEGMRYREIANVLGMSLGGVAKSLTRAIARLSAGVRK